MGFTFYNICFLIVCLLLFYLLRGELRVLLLLIASGYYLYQLDQRALIILCVSILCAYFGGILLQFVRDRSGKKAAKILLGAEIVVIVLVLLFYKIIPGYAVSHEAMAHRDVLMTLVLPIGFSYYTFQIICYLIEIVRKEQPAERNLLTFALYLAFFPKIVSGPIERPDALLPQIRALGQVKLLDPARWSEAFSYLLFGYFMKLMIADRIGPVVNTLFESPNEFSGLMLVVGSLLYTIQIYTDFAGYSMIAIGTALLFGIRLVENFNAPYLAVNISDFWRRWHMSLSRWLTDYIYIPLGGNRRGALRKCLNVMIVFLVCGFWHGSGVKFLVWGGLHGLYSVIGTLRKDFRDRRGIKKLSLSYNIGNRILTFCAVSFAWIFFGIESFSKAVHYIGRMLTAGLPGSGFFKELYEVANVQPIEKNIFLWSMLALIIADILVYVRKKTLPAQLAAIPYPFRYLLWTALALVILVYGVYGPTIDAAQFMYMKF